MSIRELGLSLYDTHSRRQRRLLLVAPAAGPQHAAEIQLLARRHGSGPVAVQRRHPHHRLAGEPRASTFDVITDEDLHAEGVDLLRPYRVRDHRHPPRIPLDRDVGRDEGLARPRRPADVLAANGWYWRIAFHDELPGVIEVRRAEDGIRTWAAEPGEYYHSFTGEYGGLWRRQGRPPQAVVGVGFIGPGLRRLLLLPPQARQPRSARGLHLRGRRRTRSSAISAWSAAAPPGSSSTAPTTTLGTPPNTLVLARSEAHTDLIMLVNEEIGVVPPDLNGSRAPNGARRHRRSSRRRAGGAVFSTGSIAWCGSLSWNGYDNNVSRITGNVLRRFLDPEPLEPGK